MFYLIIILFGVGWILASVIRNYSSVKSPISHKYLNHGTLMCPCSNSMQIRKYSSCSGTNLFFLIKCFDLIPFYFLSVSAPQDCFIYLMITPIIIYSNADTPKLDIFKDNENKSGIYRWLNLESGKSYIGSSVNLRRRFNQYYGIKFLIKYAKSSIIYKALLKEGYSKFSLEILEYCESTLLIERVSGAARRLKRGDSLLERYYLDLLKPEYIILKTAGSSLGFKHTKETLAHIAAAKLGNTARRGKNHTLEARMKIAAARKGKNLSNETKALLSIKNGKAIYLYEVKSENNLS